MSGTKKILLLSIALMFSVFAANSKEQIKITYNWVINGEESSRGGQTILLAGSEKAKAYSERPDVELIPQTPEEASYMDFSKEKTYQVADLADGTRIFTEKDFSEYPEITITEETDEILGYTCKKAMAVLRSNSIEIWFTTELNARGTPSMNYGVVDGLVLKTVRNGNYAQVATNIEKLDAEYPQKIIPADLGEKADQPLYRHRLTDSFITEVNVFDDAQINWGDTIVNPEGFQPGKIYRYAGGTVIAKKVKLPDVTSDYQVFAELTQYSNGDAYDRTGSVFMIPQSKEKSFMNALQNGIETVPAFEAANGKSYHGTVATPDFLPAVELIRFFTTFGINHYNDEVQVYGQEWEDKSFYKQDVTELLPLLQGEVWIGVYIGNYDKGGHKVSLDLKYHPGSRVVRDEQNEKPWIYSLFNTLNIMEMAGQEYGTMFEGDSLEIDFTVPEKVENVYLRYISTGHGGWGGGDEFNQKLNEIFIDGELIHSYIPWNTDCGTYRKYNPSSGNFWNGITSSDYSRSGWCPGEATNPGYIPLTNLSPGKHTLKVAIPIGEREGNSFSAWNISGVLIEEME